MLQWMGGSRRKVTTSSKSTHKRQKQYFEQRKRQQQNSSGLESCTDKNVPYTRSHENNRSLDVLSLLNLSKNGQDCTSRDPDAVEGRERLNGEDTTQNHQPVQCEKMIQLETKNLPPAKNVETRVASNHLEETVYPWDSHTDASRRNSAKDPIKMTTEHKLSVVDILSDDEQDSSPRGNLVHEKHVAFSVEGLGKVEMETPVHSPPHLKRNFSYGRPAPVKSFMSSYSSENLNCSLENRYHELVLFILIADSDNNVTLNGLFHPKGELDDMAFGVDVPVDACSLEFPSYSECRNTKLGKFVSKDCFVRNDEFYDSMVDHDAFKRDENSSFLYHNFVDDNCGLPWKNWSCDLDSSRMNHMRSRNYDKPDFSFEGIHMQKRRASGEPADCFNVSGLSSYKHQMEHDYDFLPRYPTRSRNSDFSEMTNYPAWPSYTTQDTRDCLSFTSEDSCLSRAVWREETKKPLFEFPVRQKLRTHEDDYRSPINSFSKQKNSFSQELWQKESGIFSRMRNKMPDFSTTKDDWLFEEQCNNDNTSATQMGSPFGPFDSDFNPKFYVDEKPSEQDALSGNLFSKESIDVKTGHQESFDGFFDEEKHPQKLQFQESVSTGETKPVTVPATSSTFHQRNYSPSENGAPINTPVSDSENTRSSSEESKVKTPEVTPRPNAALSPSRSEGGSSSVELPLKVEEHDGSKECANSTKASPLNQNELKCEGTHSEVDRSCKVVMLGRFVLQLL